jgi:O-antigen ligase
MRGLIALLVLALVGVPLWRIVRRTGLPPALSLLAFVPVANVIFIWVFAFMEWPALKQTSAT